MAENRTSGWLGYLFVAGLMLYFYYHSPSIGSHVMHRQKAQVPKTGHSFQGVIQFHVSPLQGYEDKRPTVFDKSFSFHPADTLQLSFDVPCRFKVSDSDQIKVTARWSMYQPSTGSPLLRLLPPPSSRPSTPVSSVPLTANTSPIPSLSLSAGGFDANNLVQLDKEWSWSLRPKYPGRQDLALTISYPAGYNFSSPLSPSQLSVAQRCAEDAPVPEYVASQGKSQLVLATEVADEFGLAPWETTAIRVVSTGAIAIIGWFLQEFLKSLFTKDEKRKA